MEKQQLSHAIIKSLKETHKLLDEFSGWPTTSDIDRRTLATCQAWVIEAAQTVSEALQYSSFGFEISLIDPLGLLSTASLVKGYLSSFDYLATCWLLPRCQICGACAFERAPTLTADVGAAYAGMWVYSQWPSARRSLKLAC